MRNVLHRYSDLASSVDDLRQDVLKRGCRVNQEEIQTMALALSNVSKALGDLKGNSNLLNHCDNIFM